MNESNNNESFTTPLSMLRTLGGGKSRERDHCTKGHAQRKNKQRQKKEDKRTMSSNEVKKNKPSNSAFKQQRLKAWQPILTPAVCSFDIYQI
jgi:hypothetical protein